MALAWRTGMLLAIAGCAAVPSTAPEPELAGFAYPYPVQRFQFASQQQTLQMAYMDVPPADPAQANGRVAVLLHGKNFCAGTWERTIDALTQAGWRVIAPDQVGFCKSTKPAHYQYSFAQLVRNTEALLDARGVTGPVTLIGHSTGGMLAIRYALMAPQRVAQLVLVAPVGLEDWAALGVPTVGVDRWLQRELAVTADSIRRYEQATYYAGTWDPAYERWVQMLASLNDGPGKERVAWNSALLYDMIQTQPVVHELGALRVPTVLMIGNRDTTAIGKDLAPPDVQTRLGRYDRLGPAAAAAIPGARLVTFEQLGHAPQIQDPAAFHRALLGVLGGAPMRP